MAKKIRLRDNVNPDDVMAVVGQTAAELGFTLEPISPTSAVAHDGGKQASGSATATRARLTVEIDGGTLKISSKTTGAAYAGAAGVGLFTARINSRYSKFARHAKKALAASKLA